MSNFPFLRWLLRGTFTYSLTVLPCSPPPVNNHKRSRPAVTCHWIRLAGFPRLVFFFLISFLRCVQWPAPERKRNIGRRTRPPVCRSNEIDTHGAARTWVCGIFLTLRSLILFDSCGRLNVSCRAAACQVFCTRPQKTNRSSVWSACGVHAAPSRFPFAFYLKKKKREKKKRIGK